MASYATPAPSTNPSRLDKYYDGRGLQLCEDFELYGSIVLAFYSRLCLAL